MRALRSFAAQFVTKNFGKQLLGGVVVSLFLIFGMSQQAHADATASSEQVILSPASQAVIDAMNNANTQVMEAAGASSALDQAVTYAGQQIIDANSVSATVAQAVLFATTAVGSIDPAIEAVVNADPVTTYQTSEVVQTAQGTVIQAQSAVDNVQAALITAQTALSDALAARAAISPLITDANAQVYQANQAIALAQATINALTATISSSHSVLANTDDAGAKMSLPFSMQMGGVLYSNIYVGSNGVITFGTDQGYYYWTTPTAPEISVGGYDWTTWSQGSGITYSTTATSLDISWDVRPFPQMDFSTVVDQLRFTADINPTTGAWVADVTGSGPNIGAARWNYRTTNNGAITQITDIDLSSGFAGHIGQGVYEPAPVNPNAPDTSAVQLQIANATQTLFALQYEVTSVASNIGTDTRRANALPSLTATTVINNAISAITNLNATITTKTSDLQEIVSQLLQAPAPAPVASLRTSVEPPAPPAPEPVPIPAPPPTPEPSPSPEPSPEPSPAPTPVVPTPEPAPAPVPIPAPQPPIVITANTTADSWIPAVAPETYLAPAEIQAYQEIGLVPNGVAQLPTEVPREAPPEALVEHVQVDVAGVENGGIEFFGTKDAPQVVGENGQLTPPAPLPGSGLPIPPDAITTTATFIGQPGGTTFNAPDIAVPVVLTPVALPAALDALPGVGAAAEAVNQAYVAMANIGNDMSPTTRKKAKKILVATIVGGAIIRMRRRF